MIVASTPSLDFRIVNVNVMRAIVHSTHLLSQETKEIAHVLVEINGREINAPFAVLSSIHQMTAVRVPLVPTVIRIAQEIVMSRLIATAMLFL